MSLILLAGLATVGAVCVAHLAWIRWPTRVVCPECGDRTLPVSWTRLPRAVRRRAWLRWCAGCGWKGIGRRGPDLSDGPVDHRSGFRWSTGRSERAPTFRWARHAERPTQGEGDAASGSGPGFRWADPDGDGGPPAHPSGFRWRGDGGS